MKKTIIAALLAAAAAAPALAADVGLSVSIGQPGFYGQINIGNAYPQPQVIYQEPVVIEQRAVYGAPVYLHVPPGHEKHWDKHCREYNACGQRVYFVRDDWYQNSYAPAYRDHGGRGGDDDHGPGHGNGNGNGRGHGHGHGRD